MKDPDINTTRGKKKKEKIHTHNECTDTGSTFHNFSNQKKKKNSP